MPFEIERKFLVSADSWRSDAEPTRIRQGYLATSPALSVRIRRAGEAAFMTVKGGAGVVRTEYEYAIPVGDADEMLDTLCARPLIEKRRHLVPFAGVQWEVDEFDGALAGLVLAELELESADQPVELPDWVGREVTDDPRYVNANLARWGLPSEA